MDELTLNKEQLQAIKFKNGPLLVIAGAGTGKTTIVTERVKHLITSGLAKPDEILALTFTEKAAQEMEERIDLAMPYGYTQMWVMTFHSFCDRILKQEGLQIGLNHRFKLITEVEATQLIRNNFFKFNLDYFRPLGNPNKYIGGMLQHFSRLQDENVSPKDYLTWVENEKKRVKKQSNDPNEKLEIKKWAELASSYQTYEELKVKEGLMDFGDLIIKTLKLFTERKNILTRYQKQFKYLLIDEFQDTNYAQNQLARLLAGDDQNITVVGDDDQSIYRFRGAAVSNIVQFRKNFPKAKVVVLTKNYRSSQEILDKAYKLIQNNNPDRLEVVEKVDKRLVAQQKIKDSKVLLLRANRVENEAEEIVNTIIQLAKEDKYDWKDFAILVRANNHAEPIIRALLRKGVPYQFLGPGRLFKQPEVIDLIAYLRVLDNYEDSVAFFRVLSMDFFEIAPRDLATIGVWAKKHNLSLFEACEKIKKIKVSQKTIKVVNKIVKIITNHLGLLKKETAGQLLYYFLEETKLMNGLFDPQDLKAQQVALNISKFFDKLKTYEVDHEDATVPAVVEWLELSNELKESPTISDFDWEEKNAVNLLTIHSAKGLEFSVVFLVNLVSQRFPSVERTEQIPIPNVFIKEVLPSGDFHIQEERRLFYVGATRAKKILVLTAANYYGEAKREKKLSPFIYETLDDTYFKKQKAVTDTEQLTFLDYTKPKKEKVLPVSKLDISYLSFSQIETFLTCPLHYKLKYLYKVPTQPSASQSFGISIHQTLRDFCNLVKEGKKPNLNLIKTCYTQNWVAEGYQSKALENKFWEKGKLYLEGFLKEGFDPKNPPFAVEKQFSVPLINDEKKEKYLKIGGVIDRIDILKDGKIEIIDYKTGATIPSQKEVDKNLQLSFYALASLAIPEKPFTTNPADIKLTLYYLDSQEKISTYRSYEQLKKAKEEIFKIRKEIEESDFKCSKGIICNKCEYSLFCQSED